MSQIPEPVIEEPVVEAGGGPVTFNGSIGGLFAARCGSCHGENAMVGLDLTTFEGLMAGSANGPVIVSGSPDESVLIQVQMGEQSHFAQFTPEELELVVQWIEAGAPQN